MSSAFPTYSFAKKPVPPELKKIEPKEGALGGYKLSQSAETRHQHLNREVKQDGAAKTYQRLNYLKVLNKNKPKNRKVLQADINWMKREHGAQIHRGLQRQR